MLPLHDRREPGDGRPAEILLFEDRSPRLRLTAELWARLGWPHRIRVAHDRAHAMSLLHGEAPGHPVQGFDLVLLSVGPGDGEARELLADIKASPALQHLPVLVIGSARDERDVLAWYHLHASCFLHAPADPGAFAAILQGLDRFWLHPLRPAARSATLHAR